MHKRPLLLQLVLLLFFGSVLIASSTDWRIALCISEDPAHHMNVSWRTEARLDTPQVRLHKNTPLAKFHKEPARIFPAQVEVVLLPDSSKVYAYSAEMTDLEAGCSYLYQVGGHESWSEWFAFQTAGEAPSPFQFIYFGDPQNGLMSHVPRAFRAAYSAAPTAAFMTMAGDLVSVPDVDQQWADYFHGGGWIFGSMPQVPVMGNHAYYWNRKWQKSHSIYWRPHFTLPENGLASLPETNYSFTYQGLLFVVLNGTEQRKEQAAWLDDLLLNSQSKWIVVSMHQPLYSTKEGRNGSGLREYFLPVFDKHDVDLVLQGHDHTFGRTFPLKGGSRVGRRDKGTIYINSVSGSKQYGLGPVQQDLFAITGSDTQYYHIIDVEKRQMVLRSYAVDGDLVDEVTISPAKRK